MPVVHQPKLTLLGLFLKSINISHANVLRTEKLSDTVTYHAYTDNLKCFFKSFDIKPPIKKIRTAEQNIV